MAEAMDAYGSLLAALTEQGYAFVCPSPETQARAIQSGGEAKTLEDFFGWNLTAQRYGTLSGHYGFPLEPRANQDPFLAALFQSSFPLPFWKVSEVPQ
jgi:hypothetical protein